MTAGQFEERYAADSGITVAELHSWGRYAEECRCGAGDCEGWAMGHQLEDAIVEDQLRREMRRNYPATWPGGHALVVEFGDEQLAARCQCGAPFGTGTPATPLDTFSLPWERHVMELPSGDVAATQGSENSP
jgi:hypothetical protein